MSFKDDSAKIAKEIKSKMNEDNSSISDLIEQFPKNLIDTILDGNIPYTKEMNQIASNILGRKIDCSIDIEDGIDWSFRSECFGKKSTSFMSNIKKIFNREILQREYEKKLEIQIDTIQDFKKTFYCDSPITIQKFICKNKDKDNFIVIIQGNNEGISGASARINIDGVGINCIYVNSYETLGRQIFTFFHELYHIYVEKSEMKKNFHVLKEYENIELESKAHRFANEILIDNVKLIDFLKEQELSCHLDLKFNQVCNIQKRFNVTFMAAIYKINYLKKLIKKDRDECKIDKIKYRKLTSCIPDVPGEFFKYKHKQYWNELERLTIDEDPKNLLNTPTGISIVL